MYLYYKTIESDKNGHTDFIRGLKKNMKYLRRRNCYVYNLCVVHWYCSKNFR